ncbi:MAG: 3-deoxy-D-manno-octulosonic acid transferase [Alphaproteobacteria bacterium]
MVALTLYRAATVAALPLIDWYLQRRLQAGKENAGRLDERRGIASAARPDGSLVWLHAASVGEAQSSLALVRLLVDEGRHVLVTTGTVTSGALLAERLPAGAIHQFVPVDRPAWVGRFLDHWRPDLALWIESELWPNLLIEAAARRIPSALVNGRMSARSFARWRMVPGLARNLLGCFGLCLAQTEAQAERFRQLGARNVGYVGNLKFSAAPLPVEDGVLRGLQARLGSRPRWLAASTHPGEEALAAAAHAALRRKYPGLLTMIVPRHPHRGPAIAAELAALGMAVARRSAGEAPAAGTDIYLADTLGELGLFYRLADIAFVGGSMASHGGHNPLEPAQLDCAVLHGPDMANFETVAAELHAAGGAQCVDGDATLAEAVGKLLADSDRRARRIAAAAGVAQANRDAALRIHAALAPLRDAGRRERDDAAA